MTNIIPALFKKLPGNALIISVIISLVISILCSSLIFLAFMNRRFQQVSELREKLEQNLQSGINQVLSDTNRYVSTHRISEDLFGSGKDSITITCKSWGLMSMASVRSGFEGRSAEKYFLYGSELPDYLSGCLYLIDHDQALYLTGQVRLTGDAFLPHNGLKIAYIDQRGFDGTRLIDGSVKNSEHIIPFLNDEMICYLTGLLSGDSGSRQTNAQQILEFDTVRRSFADSSLVINASGRLSLFGISIQGQVIIRSDSLLEVDKSANLQNVILVAPVIRIGSGFAGTIQAIASDSIIVETNCTLQYPSFLLNIKKRSNAGQPGVFIADSSHIFGGIITLSDSADLRKTMVRIAGVSEIHGFLFVEGYLELSGRVYGSVLADYFIYRKGASVYSNYLADAEINRNKLSGYFIGPRIFNATQNNNIITWLK